MALARTEIPNAMGIKQKNWWCGLLVLALVILGHAEAFGQSKTGTTVGPFLLIEPSARAAAMGNASVGTFDEVLSAFYNPGARGHLTTSGVQLTHSAWFDAIEYNYGAVAVKLGPNTLMLSVSGLDSGEMEVRTTDRPEGTGERFSVQDLALGLGFGRRITDRFSAGVQVKYYQQTIWHSQLSAFAFDFGVLYELPFRAYLGASLSNFGTRGSFDGRDLRIRFDADRERFGDNSNLPAALETEDFALPILFRVGVGLPVAVGANNRVLFTADAFQPSDNTESVSFGAEWTFLDVFSARGGYQYLFQEDSEMGLTLGSGVQYEIGGYGARFDYAWAAHERIGDTHRFTLGFSF